MSNPCPIGHYCPAGTSLPVPCPIGTYSDDIKLASVDQCKPCPGGKYCNQLNLTTDQGSGECHEGFFYSRGVDNPKPGDGIDVCPALSDTNMTLGGICPEGYYCPSGISSPIPCEGGNFSSTKGSAMCRICLAGFYCPSTTTDYSNFPCPRGSYCPSRSEVPLPCPKGTFSNKTKLEKEADCQDCTPGTCCEQPGLTEPTRKCFGGYYCDKKSHSPKQHLCPIGSFCKPGSIEPELCSNGSYCPMERLVSPHGPCSPGYYCKLGSTVSKPMIESKMGGPCPAGSYCPEGSHEPSNCPPGSFNNKSLVESLIGCDLCPAGHCCSEYGMSEAQACIKGYFCPGNQSSCEPIEFKCQPGHFCPPKSSNQIRCPSGEYQNKHLASSCKPCPPGYFCDNTDSSILPNNISLCPEGYYCPSNTSRKYQFPCPAGTFNNLMQQQNESACQKCTSGKYCSKKGLSDPDGNCNAGYICKSGASSPTPNDAIGNTKCPPGNYCPVGTSDPVECPSGHFNPLSSGQNLRDCKPCEPGHYCNESGMDSSGPKCDKGYFCRNASQSPMEEVCPEGHFCPEGTFMPQECKEGTYSDVKKLSEQGQCKICPQTYYCPRPGQIEAIDKCVEGFYCPPGQIRPNISCPSSFYCPNGTGSSPKQCRDGTYTNRQGQSECSLCKPGFYCPPIDKQNATDNIAPCPVGYYCPEGVSFYTKEPCPHGTYNPATMSQSVTACLPCKPGYYCEGEGLSEPTGPCFEGHYCDSNSSIPAKAICPIGSYCTQGSSVPIPCSNGTYTNKTGSNECIPCQAGYYCLIGTGDYLQHRCPPGSYCPVGTKDRFEYLCDDGTYNPDELMRDSSDCRECPPGKYCMGKGKANWTDDCAQGYFCSGGAKTATGDDGKGGKCKKGSICPRGAVEPNPCPTGYFCDSDGLWEPSGSCFAGYFCKENSTTGKKECWILF